MRLVHSTRFCSSWRLGFFVLVVGQVTVFIKPSHEALPIITSDWLTGNMFKKTIIWRR